mgnify:FL=1
MTIVFVTHYSGYYGANKSLLTVMCQLRERFGIKPLVLLPSSGPVCGALEEVGIPYVIRHYYWWVNDNHGAFQWLLNKRKQWRNQWKIGGACDSVLALSQERYGENPALVYTNSVCVNVGIFMAERLGVPHMWQFRESLSQFSLSLSLALSLRLWRKDGNRRYVLISDYMMRYYRPYLPAERMTCIYNGVSLPAKAERGTENVLKGRLKVAIVGVVCQQKNQLELLQAQSILHEQGIEIDTYIIGTNKKEYLQQVEAYVQEHGLSQNVHIMGHQDDVFAVLKEMNLGVVSATDEAFGRTTIEYMLMKMPVVVSDSGANTELIRNGQDGYVYPSGDIDALAAAIMRYVEQPELLQVQGKSACQYAIDNFSAEKNAEAIYKVINEVMNE